MLREGETLGKKVQKRPFSPQIIKGALSEGQNLTLIFYFGSRLSTFELKVNTKINPKQLLKTSKTTFDQKVPRLVQKLKKYILQK